MKQPKMRLGGVDIPYELLDAHRGGSLVFFVGAGASVDSPSSLPMFREMAGQIAEQANHSEEISDDTPLDRLLGQLKDRGVDVHAQVRHIIDRDGSRPNELHRVIAALARKSKTLRIVTTNYDRHLDTVLEGIDSNEHEVFDGPAVPLGDDFSGLVHLHGSLRQEDRRLIVTDSDFAAAYLTDGWATKFLVDVFASNNVLFIGYSIKDMLMQYIARGLKGAKQSYILLPKSVEHNAADSSGLERLGVVALYYDLLAGQSDASDDDGGADASSAEHTALLECLQAWEHLTGMSQLDHARRARECLRRPYVITNKEPGYCIRAEPGDAASEESEDTKPDESSAIPSDESDDATSEKVGYPTREETDYIASLLRDDKLVKHFIANARHPYWVKWFCRRDEFEEMLKDSGNNQRLRALGGWYGRLCRTHSEHGSPTETKPITEVKLATEASLTAINQLATRSSQSNQVVVESVLDTLESNTGKLTEIEVAWLMWAIPGIRQLNRLISQWTLLEILKRCDINGQKYAGLEMLRHILRLDLRFEQVHSSYSGQYHTDRPPPKLSLVEEQQTLLPEHDNVLKNWVNTEPEHLLNIAAGYIASTFNKISVGKEPGIDYDGISFRRSAIEPHSQDDHRTLIDDVIDIARDSLIRMITTVPDSARLWMDRMVMSEVPLLRRIAVHGLTYDDSRSADDRLLIIADRHLFDDIHLHHEVFQLLAKLVSMASDSTIDSLVDNLLTGWENQDG